MGERAVGLDEQGTAHRLFSVLDLRLADIVPAVQMIRDDDLAQPCPSIRRAWIKAQRLLQQLARHPRMLGCHRAIKQAGSAQAKIKRVWQAGLFGAPSFRPHHLHVERRRDPAGDGVRQAAQIGEFVLETVSPDLFTRCRVDQLHICSDKSVDARDTANDEIAHA